VEKNTPQQDKWLNQNWKFGPWQLILAKNRPLRQEEANWLTRLFYMCPLGLDYLKWII